MKVGRIVEKIARLMALAGGLVLVAITVITCVSIVGRALIFAGLGPLPGDFELVEAGVGFAVFAFLPWCQINRGHASVDIFTNFLPESVNRWIDLVAEIVMAIAVFVIAIQLSKGMMDKMSYNETTFILQFPIWWAYALSLAAAVAACIVSVWMVFVRLREVATGKSEFGPGLGAHH